jgi:hypothetical protein
MIQAPQIDGIEIDPADWAATPVSIQQLVVHLVAENQELKDRLSRIEEQWLNRDIREMNLKPC